MRGVAFWVGTMTVAAVAVGAAQARSGAGQPVSDAVRSQWETAKKNIHDSAVDVPEAVYSYAPVPTVVRTFGQIVAHVAGANYEFCSAAKGEKTPKPENAFDSLATKAAIVKTASDAIDMPFGGGKGVRVAALLGNIGHLNEHYGNLVTYMRLKGIVPPTSRGR